MDYPVKLIEGSVNGGVGTLAILDLDDRVGTCQFKYEEEEKENILLNLELKAFVDKEDVLNSISKWVLNQKGVILLEYREDI